MSRSYKQFCGAARALDVVGDRWTLLLVRNLLLGPRRYSDFLVEMPGITTNLLAKRLREMEAAGLVRKEERPPPAPATVYSLTEVGAALEPVVMELGRWGARYMDKPRRGDAVNLGWGMLSLKRKYKGGARLTVEVHVGGRVFELKLEPTYLRVRDQASEDATLRVHLSPDVFRAVFFLGAPVGPFLDAGELRVDGSDEVWATFRAAFGV